MVKFVGYACLEKGAQLTKFEYEVGEIGEDEVELDVTHVGICYSDVHVIDNDWGNAIYPFIPGHEIVGKVAAVGANVKKFKPGERAAVGWQRSSCRECGACINGTEQFCPSMKATILGDYGGYQKKIRMPQYFVYPVPEGLDSAAAAPLLCAGHTVFPPLKRWIKGPGSCVGVVGIGGLGHVAVQIAAKMGAYVVAISHSPEKREEALQMGAQDFIVDTDLPKHSERFDLILNTVNVATNFVDQVRALKPSGILCLVGIPVTKVSVDATDLVFRSRVVCGSDLGGRRDMAEMLNFCAVTGVKPIVEVKKMSQVNQAIDYLRNGKPRYRIVLEMDDIV